MPKKNRNRRNKKNSRRRGTSNGLANQDRIVVVPFRVVQNLAAGTVGYTSGLTELTVASLGPRAIANAGQFEFWRLRKLKAWITSSFLPVSLEQTTGLVIATGGILGIGFSPIPRAQFGMAPASFTDLGALNSFDMQPCTKIARIQPTRKEMDTFPLKWSRTQSTGTGTVQELSRGCVFYLLNTSTMATPGLFWISLEGEIEFSGQLSPADEFADNAVVPYCVPPRPLEQVSLDKRPDDEKSDDGALVEPPDFSAPYAPHE